MMMSEPKQPKQQLIEEVFGKNANLYNDALHIESNATDKEIEHAYFTQWKEARRMLKPTISPMKREEVNKKLEALLVVYRILSNPILRNRYNEMMVESDVDEETPVVNKSPQFNSRQEQMQKSLESSEFAYTPRSTKDLVKKRNGDQGRYHSAKESLDTSFESADATVIPRFESMLGTPSRDNGGKFIYPNDTHSFPDDGNDTDEDVFNGIEEVAFDELQGVNSSFESERTSEVNFKPFQINRGLNNSILETSAETNIDNNSLSSRTSSLRSSNTGSSLKKGRFSNDGSNKHVQPAPSNRGVRFQGIDDDNDDTTIDDHTLDSTTLGDDDLDSLKDVDSPCLNLLCVTQDSQNQIHRMIHDFSTEIRGSFDDTCNAFDQVCNAFTIQPEEYSGLVTKIETEKQTLLFSSEFMELAQKERQKRLEDKKTNDRKKSSKVK